MPDSIKKVVITFDGGAKPNPGKGYGSYNIRIDGNDEPFYGASEEFYGDNLTNNQTEYIAITRGCEKAMELLGRNCNVKIMGDSELVLKQITGEYRVRDEKLIPLNQKLMDRLSGFKSYSVQHRPREQSVEEFGH